MSVVVFCVVCPYFSLSFAARCLLSSVVTFYCQLSRSCVSLSRCVVVFVVGLICAVCSDFSALPVLAECALCRRFFMVSSRRTVSVLSLFACRGAVPIPHDSARTNTPRYSHTHLSPPEHTHERCHLCHLALAELSISSCWIRSPWVCPYQLSRYHNAACRTECTSSTIQGCCAACIIPPAFRFRYN